MAAFCGIHWFSSFQSFSSDVVRSEAADPDPLWQWSGRRLYLPHPRYFPM